MEQQVVVKKGDKKDLDVLSHGREFRKDQIMKTEIVQRESNDGKIKYIKKTTYKNGTKKSECIAVKKVGAKNADRDGFIYKKESIEE